MKKRDKNSPLTPLGEKFDKADFPVEPFAWAQMETLLEETSNKNKGGKNGGYSGFKQIIGLLILGAIIFWGGYKMGKNDASFLVNQSPLISQKNENLEVRFDEVIQTNPSVSEPFKIPIQLSKISVQYSNSKTDPSVLDPKNGYQPTFFSKGNESQKGFVQNIHLNDFKIKNNYLDTESALLNSGYQTFKNTNPYFEKGSKTSQIDDFVKKNNALDAQNRNVDVLKLAPIDTSASLFSSKGLVAFEPNSSSGKFIKDTLSKVLEAAYTPIKKSDILETEFMPFYEQTEELKSENSFDFARYGWALGEMRNIKSPLWKGKKHQLYVAFGLIENLSGFNLKYARRITPLLGLGASYYGAADRFLDFNNFNSTAKDIFELEGQFYIINRRYFELGLTLGYGYNFASNSNVSSHESKNSDFQFGAGLETRFCISSAWNIGFRVDVRENLANALLQLGYRF
jgi:hypothetical protein